MKLTLFFNLKWFCAFLLIGLLGSTVGLSWQSVYAQTSSAVSPSSPANVPNSTKPPAFQFPQFSIQTQSYVHDRKLDVYIYTHAKIEWNEITLEGGEIRVDRKSNLLVATGFVRYTDARVIATVDRLEMDLETRQMIMYNVILYDSENKVYMTAEKVRRISQSHYVATNCSITTCDPETPAWMIKSGEVNYYEQNFSSARGATLYARKIPVFYFPYLFWPTVNRRQSGFLPPEYQHVSSTEKKFKLGYIVGIPYFWAIAPDHDLTLTSEWIELRGVALNFDYKYAFFPGMQGEMKYRRVWENIFRDPFNESGRLTEEETKNLELRIPRFKYELNHNQTLDETTRMILSGQVFSDAQYQREYDQVLIPDPNYAQRMSLSIARQYEIGYTSLLFTQERVFQEIALLNHNLVQDRVQRLPELTFHLSNQPWNEPIVLSAEGSATRFRREKGTNGTRIITTPQLSYQFPFLEYFKMLTVYGKRLSFYDVYHSPTSDKDSFSTEIEQINAEINTTLTKTWTIQEGMFSRFKHLMTPRVLFDSVQDVNQDQSIAANFDPSDSLAARRLLTFRLDNILLAKRRLFERSLKITANSLKQLRNQNFPRHLLNRLENIQDHEFASETEFWDAVDKLTDHELSVEQNQKIMEIVQRGVFIPISSKLNRPTQEGPSWIYARLNLIQRYNLLREEANEVFRGPVINNTETEPGEPLLPLQIELNLNPGPKFSVDFFVRYHHQLFRIIESRADFKVEVTPANKSVISFLSNERAYSTPEDVYHSKASTLSFDNTFEATEELMLGFAGTFNLDAENTTFKRRLTSDALSLRYRCSGCYEVNFELKESVETTTTSGGRKKEILNRVISVHISLGNLELPTALQSIE
ncbi:LPS-assembly protein LptD [Deltaproteobacteria bacterium TL4]